MNERLKLLRKALNITLEEFGKKVGVTRSAVGRIEKGERSLTEQMLLSICREFNVNQEWLRTGEGEMFIEIPEEDLYSKAAASLLKEDDALGMEGLKLYWSLSPELRRAAEDHILMLADMIREHRNKKE